ncbi:hypothetical protein Tco_0951164 [Tanacetum coccineum]|uniref:Uncharacterized protein n=1 Tax=Tanacetum coccineum TaxID=301880 RepID=A0ABQ5DZB8_9ASTR
MPRTYQTNTITITPSTPSSYTIITTEPTPPPQPPWGACGYKEGAYGSGHRGRETDIQEKEQKESQKANANSKHSVEEGKSKDIKIEEILLEVLKLPSLKLNYKVKERGPNTKGIEGWDLLENLLTQLAHLVFALTKETQAASPRVEKKILEEDVENIVAGEDEESYASEFDDSVFLDEEDSGTRLEPRSHKENLETVDDDDADKKKDDKKDDDDNDDYNDDNDDHALEKMKEMSDTLNNLVPELSVAITNELIKEAVPRMVNDAMKLNLQDQVDDPELWDVLKHKFEKYSASFDPCRTDAFRKQDHDDRQEDDAPPKEEKRAKRQKTSKGLKFASKWDAWVEDTVIEEDGVIPENETLDLIEEFHNVDKHVLTIFDHEIIKATLRDLMSNQFKDAEEYAYHLEKSKNYYRNSEERKYVLSLHKIHAIQFPEEDLEEKMNRWVRKEFKTFNEEARIVEVVRITTEQHYGLDYMGQIIVMRENDKLDSFFKADFKYLNKNNIEDMYYLFLNKKVNYRENKLLNSLMTFIRSRVIWERVHDFQLGIESYQKEFCKEVKLKIFETEFLKKAPLLGELDLEIMKAYDREITKRLRRRVYMRRWESFTNGRPSLPTMRHQ